MGDYEALVEQPVLGDSLVNAICFTDDVTLKSDTWKIVHVNPMFHADPIRSQRYVKLNPHLYVADYDRSLYIDNTVHLKVDPSHIFDEYPDPITIATHSFRDTVMAEFAAVSSHGFDDQGRIFEQLNHYLLEHESILEEKPYWGGMLLRNHNEEKVRTFGEIWSSHVLRYSRRDQLSLNLAIRLSGATVEGIDLDNHHSWFHTWNAEKRNRNKGIRSPSRSMMPIKGQIKLLEAKIRDCEAELMSTKAQNSGLEHTSFDETPVAGPQIQLTRARSEPSNYDLLGGTTFSGSTDTRSTAEFASDRVVARDIADGAHTGERFFSIAIDGQLQDAAVLTPPNLDGETAVFIMVKIGGETKLTRMVLSHDGDGFATLKVKI